MTKNQGRRLVVPDLGENLPMLQYVIEMGIRGNHVLFDPDDIRRAFERDMSELADIDQKTVGDVNRAIKKIIEIEDLEEKKDYIHDLSPRLQDIIIHLYFQMIDRTLYQGSVERH